LTTPERTLRSHAWDDDTDDFGAAAIKPLTREQARALVADDPHSVSPWRVIAVQAAVGVLVALLSGLVSAKWNVFWSALYGAGVVVVPGALMARGMTSALSRMSPGASAVSFMSWEFVKIGVSVVLLVLATRIVQPLSWPALLVAAAVCIKVYWLALAWRRRR
jgi:ATP synthase protein I